MRSLILATTLLASTLYARAEIGAEFNPVAYYHSGIDDDSTYLSIPGSSYLYVLSPLHDHIAVRGLFYFFFTTEPKENLSVFAIGVMASYALREQKKNGPYLEVGLITDFVNWEREKDTNDLVLSLGYKKKFRSKLVLRPNLQYRRRLDLGDIRAEVYSLNLSVGRE